MARDYSVDITSAQWRELANIDNKVVSGRACGSCTLCCKVVSISELAKTAGVWCSHCNPGRGCGIHATRPIVCRGAYCEWMIAKGLGPEWKPDKSKLVLFKTHGGRRLTIHVDPGFPSAWRRSPFYENIKIWAREAAAKTPEMHLVDVMIGEYEIVVLPDREVEVGIVPPDEMVQLDRVATSRGETIEVRRIKRSAAA